MSKNFSNPEFLKTKFDEFQNILTEQLKMKFDEFQNIWREREKDMNLEMAEVVTERDSFQKELGSLKKTLTSTILEKSNLEEKSSTLETRCKESDKRIVEMEKKNRTLRIEKLDVEKKLKGSERKYEQLKVFAKKSMEEMQRENEKLRVEKTESDNAARVYKTKINNLKELVNLEDATISHHQLPTGPNILLASQTKPKEKPRKRMVQRNKKYSKKASVQGASHSPTFSRRCDLLKIINIIKKKLDQENLEKFKESCFGHFLEIGDLKFQGQLLSQLVMHMDTVASNKERGLVFKIGNSNMEFGPNIFSKIGGLIHDGTSQATKTCSSIHKNVFGGSTSITLKDAENAFNSVWAYETMPRVAKHCAVLRAEKISENRKILRWSTVLKNIRFNELNEFFTPGDKAHLVLHSNIEASPKEKNKVDKMPTSSAANDPTYLPRHLSTRIKIELSKRRRAHSTCTYSKETVKRAQVKKSGRGRMDKDRWRCDQGKLKAGLAKSIVEPASVLEAEINAILLGVGLCLHEELVPFVVFSDSLLAVRMLKGGRGGDSFLEDVLPYLAEAYSKGLICDFRHMHREANTVAHVVARFGADSFRKPTLLIILRLGFLSDGIPFLHLGKLEILEWTDMSTSFSTPELIKLKFDEVQNIMKEREKNMKMEMEKVVRERDALKKEMDLLEKSQSSANLEKCSLEEKLCKLESRCELLDKRLLEMEEKIQKSRIDKLDVERKLKRSETKCDDLKRKEIERERVVRKLERKNEELRVKKMESDKAAEVYKNRIDYLESMMLKLKKLTKVLNDLLGLCFPYLKFSLCESNIPASDSGVADETKRIENLF
ncbi:hypothetical protein C2S53_009741 [Perilla frutescens var. hirtella]|uniref:RNase H type-1 domain-containing protein n=1 Tax=Perilla frutescens var. hirtella TaxID=608512 RepID=A0AAD4ITW6_PERFH|nr:hypothetical protein C2S53_009741 [Perilla frutescens var. hirtella]